VTVNRLKFGGLMLLLTDWFGPLTVTVNYSELRLTRN